MHVVKKGRDAWKGDGKREHFPLCDPGGVSDVPTIVAWLVLWIGNGGPLGHGNGFLADAIVKMSHFSKTRLKRQAVLCRKKKSEKKNFSSADGKKTLTRKLVL